MGRVTLIRIGSFMMRQMWKQGSTSAACNSTLNTLYPPLPYICWALWTWVFTRYHLIDTIPIQKLRKSRLSNKFFCDFWGPSPDYLAKSAIFKIWVWFLCTALKVKHLRKLEIMNLEKWVPLLPFSWAWIVSDQKYLRSRPPYWLAYLECCSVTGWISWNQSWIWGAAAIIFFVFWFLF